jgi:hypothetical protein
MSTMDVDAMIWPEDAEHLLWHLDPASHRYRSGRKAANAADWLNAHGVGKHMCWEYRPSFLDGAWRLQRRWIGMSWGLIGPPES